MYSLVQVSSPPHTYMYIVIILKISIIGNHTLAAVRGQESYPLFSEAFIATFDEVNSLYKKGTIEVDDKHTRWIFTL